MKTAATFVGAVLLFFGVVFGLQAFGYVSYSFWAPKMEEARRTVVQQSIRRQEGVSEGIAALCLNMRLETNPESRKAFANLILVQAGGTGTMLTADALDCKAQAIQEIGI